MGKIFNTEGTCFPDAHYMVDIQEKLDQIIPMVDEGKYFCINRARQYGKSTTLRQLADALADKYIVFSLSFQRMSTAKFKDEDTFCRAFIERMKRADDGIRTEGLCRETMKKLIGRAADYSRSLDLTDMFDEISQLCAFSARRAVLIIDEVDNACNNQIFLDFLGQLRDLYLNRTVESTFQSVILAGVYDVKNLKQKIRSEDEHRYNSPWNVAADFDVDMSFSPNEIAGMLYAYEEDHHTGMDVSYVSRFLHDYTDGYPYMISRLCKLMDEQVGNDLAWTVEGLQLAVRVLLREQNALFDDMVKKLEDVPELKEEISQILFCGVKYSFEISNPVINLGVMFGFLKEYRHTVAVSNRIFEMKLYNLLLSEGENYAEIDVDSSDQKNQFILHGMLQMDIVMRKFYEYFEEICLNSSDKFIEDEGRRIFLMYLRPIINGTGNYYVEAQTRDRTRTDIIVDFKGQRFIIEMKLWYGKAYHERGEKQLFEYLDYYGQDRGYLLSFNFNKNKKTGIRDIKYGDKWIMEVTV